MYRPRCVAAFLLALVASRPAFAQQPGFLETLLDRLTDSPPQASGGLNQSQPELSAVGLIPGLFPGSASNPVESGSGASGPVSAGLGASGSSGTNAGLTTGLASAGSGIALSTILGGSGPGLNPTTLPPETSSPTSSPTTASPTVSPAPTGKPTFNPTSTPTGAPTITSKPSSSPSSPPSDVPTSTPSTAPTPEPSAIPSMMPTAAPSISPTRAPSSSPTNSPSSTPTVSPFPSASPTAAPTSVPTTTPTTAPTSSPTAMPTQDCIKSEHELADAVEHASTYPLYPTKIVLCSRHFYVESDILITGKAFELTCVAPGCGLSGYGVSRIFRGAPAYAVLKGVTFSDGLGTQVASYGGAIYLSGGEMVIDQCDFVGNSAVLGGAIFTAGDTKLAISRSSFTRNHAGTDGGAVYVSGKSLKVDDSVFSYNEAGRFGGAIFFAPGTVGYIDGADFLYNKNPAWSDGGGGALALNEASVSLSGSLFSYNTSPSGGDVYIVDDLDPKSNGSYLSCSSSYDSKNSFDGSDIVEKNSPGHYSNQNCDGFGQGTSYTVESSGNNVYGDGNTYNDIPHYVPPAPQTTEHYGSSTEEPPPSDEFYGNPPPTNPKPAPAPIGYQYPTGDQGYTPAPSTAKPHPVPVGYPKPPTSSNGYGPSSHSGSISNYVRPGPAPTSDGNDSVSGSHGDSTSSGGYHGPAPTSSYANGEKSPAAGHSHWSQNYHKHKWGGHSHLL